MEFSFLPDDVLLPIFEYLVNTADRIALAYTCTRMQRFCQQQPALFKKVDLSNGCKKSLRDAIKEFFQDELMAQHITELHLNYCFDILTDSNLEESVIASCPQLQGLHVIDCGMNVRSIHRILQNAHKLTDLSWSMLELSPEDLEFLEKDAQSNKGIRLENIKNLWIHTAFSRLHAEILSYLLLCHCKCIEKIVITFSEDLDLPYSKWNCMSFPCEPSSSKIDTLQHLHSLVVDPSRDHYKSSYYNHILKFFLILLTHLKKRNQMEAGGNSLCFHTYWKLLKLHHGWLFNIIG